MEYTIAGAKKEFANLLREAHERPVVITRRGQPDVVVMAFSEYEQVRRLLAYQRMLRLSDELRESGPTAEELYSASRAALEERP
jgi:prevent-host-death family protein